MGQRNGLNNQHGCLYPQDTHAFTRVQERDFPDFR